jgi:hypothetical protein
MKIRRILALVLLAVCGIALAGGFAQHYRKYYADFYVDDAGITFSYARNLAEGYGLVVNRGGETVEGYSNPTWLLLLAAGYRLGVDAFASSKALGLLFGMAGLLLAVALAARLFTRPGDDGTRPAPWAGLWAVPLLILCAASGSYVGWAASGLENALWVALALATLLAYDREIETAEPRLPWSGFLAFLLAVTRPEGFVFAGTLIAHRLFVRAALDRKFTRSDALFLAAFAVPFGAYHAWHYAHFAWFFPNTYYAKLADKGGVAELTDFNSAGWRYVRDFFDRYRYAPLLIPAVVALVSRDVPRRRLPLIGWTLLTAIFAIYAAGDWMRDARFLTLVQVGLPILAGGGFAAVAGLTRRLLRAARVAAVLVLAAGVAWLARWTIEPYAEMTRDQAEHPTTTIDRIKIRADYFRGQADLADVRDTASLLEPDLGANSYYSGLETVDVAMLTDVAIAHQKFNREFIRQYIFQERKPTFMHIREKWANRSGIRSLPEFKRDYIQLPEWRKKSERKREIGDYARLDVFRAPRAEDAPPPVASFDGLGVALVSATVPYNTWMPGREVKLRFTWTPTADVVPDLTMSLTFTGENDWTGMQEWKPVYGWQPTTAWLTGFEYSEVIHVRAPEDAPRGPIRMTIGVRDSATGTARTVALPDPITIDADAAREEARVRLAGIAKSPDGLAAYGAFRLAIEQAGREIDADRKGRAEAVARAQAYALGEAGGRIASGDEAGAVDVLARVKKIAPRYRPVLEKLRELAEPHYRKGRELQEAGKNAEAFAEFSRAHEIDPSCAWTRRRMEETRPLPTGTLAR